jgi:hypothetical protein
VRKRSHRHVTSRRLYRSLRVHRADITRPGRDRNSAGRAPAIPEARSESVALEARADEDCHVVEVRHERWLRDLAASAAAVREFVARTCVRLAQADRRLIMMARRSADERIGMLLLEQASTDQRDVPRGCGKVTQTHAEIAQAAAMTRPHVSVTLGQFRRKGLIRYRRHEAMVVEMQRLRAYLERLDADG